MRTKLVRQHRRFLIAGVFLGVGSLWTPAVLAAESSAERPLTASAGDATVRFHPVDLSPGTSPETDQLGATLRLFHTRLWNPLPDQEIQSLDFVSLFSRATPVLVGLTVEEGGASPAKSANRIARAGSLGTRRPTNQSGCSLAKSC